MIDPQLASMEHLRPGATLRMTGIPYNPKGGAPDLGLAFPVSFLVTGIGVFDDQIVPVTGTNNEPLILLSPAFSRTARAQSVIYLPEAGVRLRPGASPAAFAATARTLAARYPQVQSSDMSSSTWPTRSPPRSGPSGRRPWRSRCARGSPG